MRLPNRYCGQSFLLDGLLCCEDGRVAVGVRGDRSADGFVGLIGSFVPVVLVFLAFVEGVDGLREPALRPSMVLLLLLDEGRKVTRVSL